MPIKNIIKYDVHLTIYDRSLVKWIQNKVQNGDFSPNMVFRDAVKELKAKDERDLNPEYLKELNRKIDNWKRIVEKQRDFLQSTGQIDKFIKWDDKQKPPVVGITTEKNTNLN